MDSISYQVFGKVVVLNERLIFPVSPTFFHHSKNNGNDIKKNYYCSEQVIFSKEEMENIPSYYSIEESKDKKYFSKIKANIEHLFYLFDVGIKNERQLIYTDDSDCISLIHIMPRIYEENLKTMHRSMKEYSVLVYQRSAYLTSLIHDMLFIKSLFKDAAGITYVLNNVHYIKESI